MDFANIKQGASHLCFLQTNNEIVEPGIENLENPNAEDETAKILQQVTREKQ